MIAVGKALWFIESHFASEITLEEIAKVVGVSRFHVTHALGTATGHSIMRYVRGRRLTEAAKTLSRGAPDILSVAPSRSVYHTRRKIVEVEVIANPERLRALDLAVLSD